MICERCKKNEANYYYRENVNGTEKTYRLCGECMKELEKSGEIKGFGKDSSFDGFFGANDLNAVFASLFAPSQKRGQTPLAPKEKTKCSLCGASFEELVREGKVGCPKCYDVFAGELEESIRRIHGRSTHTGKEPVKFRELSEVKRRIEAMKQELKDAIKQENYERAVELRDEIRALESKGASENSADAANNG